MRTIFAIAALAASASAVKMNKIPEGVKPPKAEPTAAAEQNSNCNLVESSSWMTQGNTNFDGQFDTPYYWYNQMQGFWSQFNSTEAFQYFDCVHGNSDGFVDFTEYNAGLYQGGYVPDANCSAQYFKKWEDSFGVQNDQYVIDEDVYCGANTDNIQDEWCFLGGDCDNKSLNHNDFMINSMRMGSDISEAQTAWTAANTNNRRHQDTVTKKEWMKQQNDMYHGMWQFLEEQMVAVPLPGNDQRMLPVQMWYFSQNCFAAENYWTALSQDPSYMAWNSPISYDIVSFQSQLCASWELCEN